MGEEHVYTFILTKSEAAALGFQHFKKYLIGFIATILTLVLICFDRLINVQADLRILISPIMILMLLLLGFVYILIQSFCTYCILKKLGFLSEQSYQIEQRHLINLKNGSSRCLTDYVIIIRAKTITLVDRTAPNQYKSMIVLPKRIFSSEEDISQFTQLFTTVLPALPEPTCAEGAFHITYSLTSDDFAHAYTEIKRLIRIRHTYLFSTRNLAFVIFALIYLKISFDYISNLIWIGASIIFLIFLFFKTKDINEKRYRRLAIRNRLPVNESGIWNITFNSNCIDIKHNNKCVKYPWSIYTYLYETVDTFFLVQADGKRPLQYTIFPKWAFENQEQQKPFLNFCEQKGYGRLYFNIYEVEQQHKAATIRIVRDTLLITFTLLFLIGGLVGELNYLLSYFF